MQAKYRELVDSGDTKNAIKLLVSSLDKNDVDYSSNNN